MFQTVMVGDKNVELLSNAATPLFYKNIFGGDILRELGGFYKDIDGDEQNTEAVLGITDTASRLGFVMNLQATVRNTREIMKHGEAEYIDWLGQFDAADFLDGEVIKGILSVYLNSQKTSSVSKKKSVRR